MVEEKQRSKADFLGLLTLLVVAGSVFAGMWMTVEIVNAQSDLALSRIESSSSMLHHENRELRSLLKTTLEELRSMKQGQEGAAAAPTAEGAEVAAAEPAGHHE